ncbi:1-aminocyclopropane-1-carboxylate oxidase [Musa troglodytarum]|uniref:1-aminocyclopropane-1-carboxylate oxidase n=1 Tax=Musa troglodytarum TaxID=320322 RepID=A0A9E7K0Q7_9LILI|nr:1-aminocyclopropane-1-carboxylate oxidase [Musa troglodytarum]
MEVPVIDLAEFQSEERSKAMSRFHQVCGNWGFFWVENHGVDAGLMEEVKRHVYSHYDKCLKERFYDSELAKGLGPQTDAAEVDWETTYFVQHQPESSMEDDLGLGVEFREVMDAYVSQLTKLAEKLAELVSENLGLDKDHLKKTFAPPFVGTKVAMYPRCPQPGLVRGLRGHSDAGGIILLLQDDTVPGLEFFKDGEWVPVTPNKGSRIFVNFGDQVEVVSNGLYRSMWHRVLADEHGSRLSVATFYNPGGDAIVGPAPKLLYPGGYRFQDYLHYYFGTKFSDKGARFQAIKEMLK